VAASASARQNLADTSGSIRSVFERSFRAGETIYDEGEQGDVLFVIQSGQVELIRRGEGPHRLISRHGAGEFFGEMSVLLGRTRMARAVAVADTRVLQLDARTFEAMCVEQPEIAIRVIQRLASRVTHLEQRLAAVGADDMLRPVVRVLVRRLEREGPAGRVPGTLRDLAGEAGLSLVDAHRALGYLMDQRLVRLADDVLLVGDVEALSAALDTD
jgi:CRP/FNR family cyclic AMP-dependent transcriptional regulator